MVQLKIRSAPHRIGRHRISLSLPSHNPPPPPLPLTTFSSRVCPSPSPVGGVATQRAKPQRRRKVAGALTLPSCHQPLRQRGRICVLHSSALGKVWLPWRRQAFQCITRLSLSHTHRHTERSKNRSASLV